MKETENKLTPRQWATYNLIKENTINGILTTKEQIVNNYSYDSEKCPQGYLKHETSHDLCSSVWSDINAINFSAELDKIIITDGKNNFKIAQTLEEAENYLEVYKVKAMKALMRMANIGRKIRRDGQGKLLSNRLEPINSESRAREYVETFLKNE